ncbi:histidine kinase 1 [Selaginella moellendorffii]|uniref:histidine kinase 1 n=1 Tax=Selaginella moellendorffii TaxID=88036 RepID=UPI000D1C676E|nr:histidine kinase 1 [Selaginella moellendorffii]|eukprot:XP_002983081.2 histidine kinase 1 [Selaginella moellendorffii]
MDAMKQRQEAEAKARDSIDCSGRGCESLELPKWCFKREEDGKETVLEHIILDMMGSSVTVENFANAAVHRAFCRKRRLLDRTNTVLVSRLAIMILFALMLVCTSLVTWYYTSTYSKKAVNHAASVLRRELLQSSLQTTSLILGETYNMSSTLSSLHQNVFLSKRNWASSQDEIRRINWAFLSTRPQLSSVSFLHRDGYAVDYSRVNRSEYLFFANESSAGVPKAWYMQNLTGSKTGIGKFPAVESNSTPYVINPSIMRKFQASQANWSIEPGVFGEPVIAAAASVLSESNEFIGVSAITTSLKELTNYLSTVDLLGGFLYVVWKDERNNSKIIAMSSEMQDTDILCDARNSSNPTIAAAATFLESGYKNNLLEVHAVNVNLMGTKYYIDTMPVNNSPFSSLKLTAVAAIPKKRIMGKIESWKRTVVAVSVSIAIAISIVGCLLICVLTSNMSTEMQLKQELIRQLIAKHRAEQLSNHKSQFLANMSHELRTPMAGIIGMLDILSCDTLTPEQETSVGQIRRCATGLLSMVNNVLDISKVEAGKMDLDLAPFNLASELESLVDMFAAQSYAASVDVALDLSDTIPQALKGDACRIRQIFSNLLSNSMKFTENGHIVIRGWADEKPEISSDGPSFINVIFEVDDTGCGIPSHMHETVFDSFVQADASSTRIHGGSGLGLYIVRSLVQKMGGEVQVICKQGPGTLIRFNIVMERLKDVPPETLVASSPSPDSLSSLIGSPQVYVSYPTPSFSLLERTQVVVAMPDGMAASTCIRWLEKKGTRVTHVSSFQDVLSTMEAICSSGCNDFRLNTRECQRAGYFSDLADYSPLGSSSAGCSSRTLESFLEAGSSLLALIDVSMFPWGKSGPSDCESSSKMPASLLEVLSFLSRIRHRHSLAVGWIAPPDSGISFKKALQVAAPSVILIKPLHASRMKRLLTLLQRVSKFEPASSEPLSCISSGPSTPRLTSSVPVRHCGGGLGIVHHVPSSDVAYHSDDYILSTPGSPTSGLLTPEVVNTTADGVQEDRKGAKDLENEWSGPVIDLRIPTKPKSTSSARSPFSLPESEISTSNASPTHAAVEPPGSKPLAGLRILVVEDTPILQRMIGTILGKLGAEVTIVGDGQQAVTAVAKSVNELLKSQTLHFDLILMDCAMPVMDGYSATKAIRESEADTDRHIPIVALTAHALTSDEAKCRAVGMDAYLTKPINCKLMVSTIQELVKKQ